MSEQGPSAEKDALHSIWREAAEKGIEHGIEHGIDWPRVVLDLFREIDRLRGEPQIGYVQKARWGEWEAVCTVPRCGWHHSQGNRTQADAEKHMRGHAALVHPPRVPVTRVTPPGGSDD